MYYLVMGIEIARKAAVRQTLPGVFWNFATPLIEKESITRGKVLQVEVSD